MVGDERPQLAQRPGGQQLADPDHVRHPPGPHRLEHHELLRGREVDELLRLCGVQREGLLEQHVLARVQRENRVVVVVGMRRADVDHVDLRVRHQRLIARVSRRDAVRRREGVCGFLCAGSHRRHGVPGQNQVGCHLGGDPPGAQDAPAQSIGHGAKLADRDARAENRAPRRGR